MFKAWLKCNPSVLIFVLAFASRLVIMPAVPSEWDSVQLVFGMTHFDLYEDSPHPPGYWLYVEWARLVDHLTPLGATHSMGAISAFMSGLSAVLAWHLGVRLRGRLLGLGLTALVVGLPFSWFYGSIPAVYGFDLFAGLLFLNLALRAEVSLRDVVIASVALGLLTGFRQSALSIFGPLVLYIALRVRPWKKSIGFGIGAGLVSILAWLIPAGMTQPGGIGALVKLTKSMWQNAANQTSVFGDASTANIHFNIGRSTAALVVSLLFVLPVFVLALLATGVRPARLTRAADAAASLPRMVVVGLLASVPGFLVTTFGHFGKPGYILAFVPGLLLLGVAAILYLRQWLYYAACVGLVVVGGVWTNQFLRSDGILPEALQNKSSLWFTQDRYGAPYRDNVHKGTNLIDADAAQYKPLAGLVRPSDTLVYEGAEGVWRFRQQNYLFPQLVQEMTDIDVTGVSCSLAWNRAFADCLPNTVEVQPGGRAVFVANAPNLAVKALVDEGRATAITLPTGPTAFAVDAGVKVGNLDIVENPNLKRDIPLRALMVRP